MSVYLAAMASDLFGKVVGVWIPLSTFVVLQFEHVVADMFTVSPTTGPSVRIFANLCLSDRFPWLLSWERRASPRASTSGSEYSDLFDKAK